MRSEAKVRPISGLPLFGNLFEFRSDRLGLQRRLAAAGDLGAFRMGPIRVHMASSAELAHAILVEHSDAFIKSRGLHVFARPLLGDGLLTSEHEKHTRQRKLLAPAFSHKRIAAYADVMATHAERAQWEWADGEERDLAEEMMKLTLAIVGRTLFDADVTGDAHVIGDALTEAMRYLITSVSSMLPLPLGLPTARNRRMRRALADLDAVIYRIIAERRAAGSPDRGDVLSMLLAARDDQGGAMSDRQIRDEAMTLILAGHETTANALAWSFYLLTQHPTAYARLEAEVDAALGGRVPRMEDLARLPFALAVLKESMRLYPPAYLVGRQAERDVEVVGRTLRKGDIVMVNIFGMYHRAEYFADPERFDPDRFAPEAEKALPRGAYLPFGAGPRICIGNHFALMEGQLILAALAQRVRFALARDPRVEAEPLVTLRPKGGLAVRITRRNT